MSHFIQQKKAEEDLKKLNTKIEKTREQLAGTEPLYQEQHKREETAAQQYVFLLRVFFGTIYRHLYHVFNMILLGFLHIFLYHL